MDGQTDRETEFSSLDHICIPCSAVKMDLTYFKCQIIRFTLMPSDGSGQEHRNGQQLVLYQSAAQCPVQHCRRQICVHSQTPGGTCPMPGDATDKVYVWLFNCHIKFHAGICSHCWSVNKMLWEGDYFLCFPCMLRYLGHYFGFEMLTLN